MQRPHKSPQPSPVAPCCTGSACSPSRASAQSSSDVFEGLLSDAGAGAAGSLPSDGAGRAGGALHHLETIPDLRLSLPAVLSPVLVPPPAVKKHTMNWNNTTTTQGNPLHVNRI